MKPAIISSITAKTGDFAVREDQFRPHAYLEQIYFGHGCIDATDFLPMGSTKNEPLYFQPDDVFCGFVGAVTVRARASA